MAWTFSDGFRSLTDYAPMAWQCRLFERFMANKIPGTCDIPTGLGKTSVMIVWLLALAQQAKKGCVTLPRRLIYIVNRRTVVDQATSIAEGIRERLITPGHPKWNKYAVTLSDISSALRELHAFVHDEPIGISTLRGELAENEEWKTDPARPTIVVGTVDMVGSKLLFSGYGDGRYWRPHHAGLIGQDTLIVHDEAHLTPAFSEVLQSVAREQEKSKEPRPVQVIELSATQRGEHANVFKLEPEDEKDPATGSVVTERLDAVKKLRLHRCEDLCSGIVEKATRHLERVARVLIYLRSPDDAQKVANLLRKALNGADDRVALLTGTIRGHERDRLVSEHPVFRAFLDHNLPLESSVFLVSTSAGEVGVDIDADHMVCDLAPLDSLIQRLGRVNRRGGLGRTAFVDVVWMDKDVSEKTPMDKAVLKTQKLLRQWVDKYQDADGLLVSPRKVRELVEQESPESREAAFSPKPRIVPLTDILLDNWSMTSLDGMPGRWEVAAYLHGLTADPPETFVVWRKEVQLFAGLERRREDLSRVAFRRAQTDFEFEEVLTDWFRACRVEARERLRDRSDRVRDKLRKLLATHRKADEKVDFPVVLLDERGLAKWSRLSQIIEKRKDDTRDPIAYRTVVLPVEARGLDRYGMLTGDIGEEEDMCPPDQLDVAGAEGVRSTSILCQRDTEFWVRDIMSISRDGRADNAEKEEQNEVADIRQFESPEDAANAFATERGLVVSRLIALNKSDGEEGEGDEEGRYLILMVSSVRDDPERSQSEQKLDDHTNRVIQNAKIIRKALNLPDELGRALVQAAYWHDRGKDRPIWQDFATNDDPGKPLAKSRRYRHPRVLVGYRHEFGSLLEAARDNEVLSDAARELTLHLVAAHHGWARPHFERRAFDHRGPVDPSTGNRRSPTTEENEICAIEVLQRFARLQQRFGRWGLAWLESLLRCADIGASKPLTAWQPPLAGSSQPSRPGAGS